MNNVTLYFKLISSNGGVLAGRLDQFLLDHGFWREGDTYEAIDQGRFWRRSIRRKFWEVEGKYSGKAEVRSFDFRVRRDEDADPTDADDEEGC